MVVVVGGVRWRVAVVRVLAVVMLVAMVPMGGMPWPVRMLVVIVSPAAEAAPRVTAPRRVVPPGMAPKTPATAVPVGEKVPVANPNAVLLATPIRMPAPMTCPPGTNMRPTPMAVTPTAARVPQGSLRIASVNWPTRRGPALLFAGAHCVGFFDADGL